MLLTKVMHIIFNIDTARFSKSWHHIIKISVEFLATDGTGVKNGKFHSLVQTLGNIPPIFIQFRNIYNGDVEYWQENFVVGKEFLMFLKDRLEDQG